MRRQDRKKRRPVINPFREEEEVIDLTQHPNIWFTSDEHHGHQNVLGFCNRPFSSLEEMTEEIVRRHNEVVKPCDLVYHLGDMFWRTLSPVDALNVMRSLNGQHFYIRGNHEELFTKFPALANEFVWVKERAKIHPAQLGKGHPGIVLDHYAGSVWNGSHKGSWQTFGHSHGEYPHDGVKKSLDVGVDCWNYYPVSLEQVQDVIEGRLARPKPPAKPEEVERYREG